MQITAVELGKPLRVLLLDNQRLLVHEFHASLPVVGAIIRHVGDEHTLGVVGSGIAQVEFRLVIDVVGGFPLHPETLVQESDTALNAEARPEVLELRGGQQVKESFSLKFVLPRL